MILYGSQARREARPESDIDVLVVLRREFDGFRENRFLVDIAMDVFDRYGINVHFLPVTAARYADTLHPLMVNVHAEGIEV